LSKNYWLMKTEPDTFSFDDLVGRPDRTDRWEGVRNYQARNMMRDQFQLGDEVFIYHSRVAEPAIVGVARVVRAAYPDPTALDPQSKYFDSKSVEQGISRWVMVNVQAVGRFMRPITLKELRDVKGAENMLLLRPGQRLSIQPVQEQEWQLIHGLSRLERLPELLPNHV
jgi:predicted RNA-binding protein with PUA-like domain